MENEIPSFDTTKTATIYDVAKLSGMSVSTVSRVINNSPNVSEKTRKKVEQAIRKTHFSPSSLARAMNSRVTKNIGVMISDITNPYFSTLYLEIQRYAVEIGYSILLCNTFFGGSSHGVAASISETTYFEMLLEKKVDGILILGGEIDRDKISDEYIRKLDALGRQVPVVVVGEPVDNCCCSFLRRNFESGIPMLVTHLAALGRTKIGFVGGEPEVKTTTLRIAGYQQALKNLMMPQKPEWISLNNYYMADGYEAAKKLLLVEDRPTAVIAVNDAVAMGAIRAFHDNGLKVPEDISVVSCDQFPNGEYYDPSITSLDRNDSYLGRLSIMALLSKINNEEVPTEIAIAPRLVVRESCGGSQGLHFYE